MPKSNKDTNLVWMDLEMTGLDLNIHEITQVAIVITNTELEVLFPGIELIIHHSPDVLHKASDWVKQNAKDLLLRSEKSKLTQVQAEKKLLRIIKKYTNENMSPLCGNSIWVDRMFARKYMPSIDKYLLHRNIDVSSIKELYKRWHSDPKSFEKKETHTALEDIKESIAELNYYRKLGFIG